VPRTDDEVVGRVAAEAGRNDLVTSARKCGGRVVVDLERRPAISASTIEAKCRPARVEQRSGGSR